MALPFELSVLSMLPCRVSRGYYYSIRHPHRSLHPLIHHYTLRYSPPVTLQSQFFSIKHLQSGCRSSSYQRPGWLTGFASGRRVPLKGATLFLGGCHNCMTAIRPNCIVLFGSMESIQYFMNCFSSAIFLLVLVGSFRVGSVRRAATQGRIHSSTVINGPNEIQYQAQVRGHEPTI